MRVFIGCSSKNHYDHITREVAASLAKEGYDLVFGAASFGMMGLCYEEFLKENREITSITVSEYEEDLKNINSTKEFLCDNTFLRTSRIYENSDVLVFLPGGSGTVNELFSILEELRTRESSKQLILYNVPYKEGYYYDFFEQLMQRFIEDGYNDHSIKNYYQYAYDTKELVKKIGGRI